jgi:IS1 family transposase
MPNKSTTHSWLFPPNSEEIQFDAKWDFVHKKQKKCAENNPADSRCGGNWDHVAIDAEHKLVLEVVNGKRTEENTKTLAANTAKRLNSRIPRLITSDEYKPYKKAILQTFGVKRVKPKTGRRGRPCGQGYQPHADLVYVAVHKTRENGRVTHIDYRVVFGSDEQMQAALAASSCSRKINTSFIERQNGTDRNRCSRKIRKSYCFLKDWDVHRGMTCLTMYSYNFCWAVRTLRRPDGLRGPCSPAMAAGLADHLWTIREWLTQPVCKSG